MAHDIVILQENIPAYMVPSGARILLHAGTEVKITQALGESFSVNVYGNLARIDGKFAEALGQEPINPLANLADDATLEDKAWLLMKSVFDPEIPVNVVDLGLIYGCEITPLDDGHRVMITMTLTAPGCGMGPVIADDIKQLLLRQADFTEVEVSIVFEPAWEQSMMSTAAKLELGML